ncbi:MAG: hypothetical protein HWE39_05585 [Oceanospirillaceae bacterium]|nr:hypothetical protein [Oceanospirillaceae bacterium]
MKKLLFVPALLASYCTHVSADCPAPGAPVAATYQVTATSADNTETRYNMTLWRAQDRVAHQYPQSKITHLWDKAANGALHLERHFDDYGKGIEYQPLDINGGKGDKDWSLKYQLISDQLKERMTLVEAHTGDCGESQTYALAGEPAFHLTWLPGPQLLEAFEVRDGENVTTWTLSDIESDPSKVAAFFEHHAQYQLTDYADIGDNEADPFIRSMIHLGFIEHGASGVYDADGHAIGDHQH